jgi:hypothetical protein
VLLGLATTDALAVGGSDSLGLGTRVALVDAATELLGLPDTAAVCRGKGRRRREGTE